MANFEIGFEKGIIIEGGYKLINIKGDRGGLTYAGISKVKHPNWKGWKKIAKNEYDSELTGLVKSFYKTHYWDKILGDRINSQDVATIIYLFSMNMGRRYTIKITQKIIKCTPDGVFGNITLRTLNDLVKDKKDEKIFILTFGLLTIFRYKNICLYDKRRKLDKIVSNEKFLCGWINRTQQTIIG